MDSTALGTRLRRRCLGRRWVGDKKGGVICTVRPGKANTDDVPKNVEVTDVLVFTAFLKPHTYKEVYHWPVRTLESIPV